MNIEKNTADAKPKTKFTLDQMEKIRLDLEKLMAKCDAEIVEIKAEAPMNRVDGLLEVLRKMTPKRDTDTQPPAPCCETGPTPAPEAPKQEEKACSKVDITSCENFCCVKVEISREPAGEMTVGEVVGTLEDLVERIKAAFTPKAKFMPSAVK